MSYTCIEYGWRSAGEPCPQCIVVTTSIGAPPMASGGPMQHHCKWYETPAPRTFTAEEVRPLVEALREAGIILAKLREDYPYDCPVDTSTAADKLAAALAIWYAKLSAPAKDKK